MSLLWRPQGCKSSASLQTEAAGLGSASCGGLFLPVRAGCETGCAWRACYVLTSAGADERPWNQVCGVIHRRELGRAGRRILIALRTSAHTSQGHQGRSRHGDPAAAEEPCAQESSVGRTCRGEAVRDAQGQESRLPLTSGKKKTGFARPTGKGRPPGGLDAQTPAEGQAQALRVQILRESAGQKVLACT